MHILLVMPCLNEADHLSEACASLGFGNRERGAPPEARLVLVDNGSEDQTPQVMESVARRSPSGAVVVVGESERGYVPARHCGVIEAGKIAAREGLDSGAVLILQVDADTTYQDGYIAAMTAASRRAGTGHLVEGISEAPHEDDDPLANFYQCEHNADLLVAPLLFADDRFDVVVDDKVAGYFLSDYLDWGGHRREYTASGEEILAETTRLFLKARLLGASRQRAEDAVARTSPRRIMANPALAFATAGFPRGDRWQAGFQRDYAGPNGLTAFDGANPFIRLSEILSLRMLHVVAIFGLLPAYVAKLVGEEAEAEPWAGRYASLIDDLNLPDIGEAIARPGAVLDRILTISLQQLDPILANTRP